MKKSLRALLTLENAIYLALWVFLFLAPVLSMYVKSLLQAGMPFDWDLILRVWGEFGACLLVFLVHNFLLAPQLVYRNRKKAYFAWVLALLVVVMLVQCIRTPEPLDGPPPHEARLNARGPEADRFGPPQAPPQARPLPHEAHADGPRPPHDASTPPPEGPRHEPAFFGPHDLVAFVVVVLMLGMNLGVKLYFRSDRYRQKLRALEHENLQQQLEYLKYQINPHFFMNTLNNIHALVDIDPPRAQESIVQLSKLMRYVLYEGAETRVPLTHELDFLTHYITLMRLRFHESVRIEVDLPQPAPDHPVPPLIFATFVENAFVHGVSYEKPSFIEVRVRLTDSELHFECANSKHPSSRPRGGIGLANVLKRLQLLYGDAYRYDVTDTPERYAVALTLPLQAEIAV